MEVYVKVTSRTSRHVYHTDEECYRLQEANGYRSVERSVLFDELRPCQQCSGEAPQTGPETPANGHTGPNGVNPTRCHSCGADKPPDGPCEFCEDYEDVMGPFA